MVWFSQDHIRAVKLYIMSFSVVGKGWVELSKDMLCLTSWLCLVLLAFDKYSLVWSRSPSRSQVLYVFFCYSVACSFSFDINHQRETITFAFTFINLTGI